MCERRNINALHYFYYHYILQLDKIHINSFFLTNSNQVFYYLKRSHNVKKSSVNDNIYLLLCFMVVFIKKIIELI